MSLYIKTLKLFTWKKVASLLLLLALIVVGVWGPLAAQSISQGYGSDKTLQKGMLVSIDKDNGTKVVIASRESKQAVYGVVVNANDAPVTLSSEGEKVFVATEGRYDLLVSDQAGAIKTGDYLTLSNVNGVAMKADKNQPLAVAKALADYNGSDGTITTIDQNGKSVHIARIATDISIGQNPLAANVKSSVPEVLQSASELIANKRVNPVRLYVGLVVFLFTVVITGSMLYAGIKSSITAIGRNPLSKKDIRKSLFQVIVSSIIVFIIGLFAVYLLLKL